MITDRAHRVEEPSLPTSRLRVILLVIHILVALLIMRLFYWQVVKGAQLRAEALSQYQRTITNQGKRGSIYTADGYALVTNEERYRLVGYPYQLEDEPRTIAQQLAPVVWETQVSSAATSSAQPVQEIALIQDKLTQQLGNPETKWVSLAVGLTEQQRQQLQELQLKGVGFEPYFQRMYPEASMAAHVLGFVGRNDHGEEVGYFGVEGALDKELQGRSQRQILEADALGWRFLGSMNVTNGMIDGRDVVLTIRRDIQHVAEAGLKYGMERYGAKSGEVIIMEPSTGKILAMASSPGYAPGQYRDFEAELYKNPSVTDLYEPGSTLKTLTVAAGIDAGVITPQTQCDACDGPRVISRYTLRTWNNQYNPGITMLDALAKSDNTAMIFVAEKLGVERLRSYLKAFGLGERTNTELHEDTRTPFPERWGPVELATISFGQGISANTLQVVKAIGAIANQGKVMRPMIVERVVDPVTQEQIEVEPQIENQAVSATTAQTVTQMMVNAADHGEAQWTASRDHWIAGKTGTSQIAAEGQYATDRTIASFIGFAPPDKPKFIMMVKLVEPQSSPWAAETAAPLWYRIANQLYILLDIPPDKELLPAAE